MAAALACMACSAAHAIDALGVETGIGDDRTAMIRLSVIDRWRKHQNERSDVWRLAGYWDFSGALWDNSTESTADVGITPVFRVERNALYIEGAIGVHFVQARISAHRSFSTALQFGTHAGAGLHLGKKYDLGVRIQHLSNGHLKQPNPGINFALVHLQYALE
ncbi:MAG TPA: acyloxyacyl hydrolase [Burkholderiales bacterium]|nr:acyloxyacyl hydrolase [Burkholderiales bacterium]